MKLPRGVEGLSTGTAPTARWMKRDELAARVYKQGDPSILLGKADGQMIGTGDDDRHLMTVAGSRAGKSSTCLLPNLLRWPSSVLCIDPKGELAMKTAKERAAMGQDVFILDPFEEVKGEAARFRVGFDPLSEIREGHPRDVIDNAALVADALIVPANGASVDHWTLSAKNLLRGLILYALAVERPDTPASLPLIRYMVTTPLGDDTDKGKGRDAEMTLSAIFQLMSRSDAFGGTVAGVGGTMRGKPTGERGSIISTAVEQTAFLDGEVMEEQLSGKGLSSLRILKRKPTTIYLVLPASRMATHFRWLRVILTLAMAALEREPMGKLPAPVLFILEEFPQLGYMRQIEAAAGLMAGYQVKLWTVLQDLSQLKSQYRDSWETFVGNAGVVQAFGNTDASTLEYISRALGTLPMTEHRANRVTPTATTTGAGMTTEHQNTQPLLAPFEVALYAARDTGKQVVMFAGKPPAYLDRLTHQEASRVSF